MNALDLTGLRRAVVIAPHPDDEVIGAFGLIRRLREHGVRVQVIVATDGAASHRHSARFPPKRLAAARRAESRAGMARAGVAAHDVHFLARADGSLGDYDSAACRGLARDMARGPAPDLLVLPSPADDHPDHRTVARAGRLLWPRCRQRLAYLVWPRTDRPTPPTRLWLSLGDRHWHMKRAALACHRTQTGLIEDDPDGFHMSQAERVAFTRPIERFT
ncbi:PIG-L deacetylase family protein [Salinisphaera hydrothermalis]|uniref:PIG-L deacetylase family protein n=1 Tax=Salinisphaera hydrothermalis TaxID=563188 RepID=UPI00333F6CF0